MKGLILAGGLSSRMGTDKALLSYQDKLAWQLIREKFIPFCEEVFISCRAEQAEFFKGENILPDRYSNVGPISGVLTALETFPGADWLVLAVDMPLVAEGLLKRLVNTPAPVFFRAGGFIEPLAGVYPARLYPALSKAFNNGNDSLQRILRELPEVNYIDVEPHELRNINTPDDYLALGNP